MVWLTSISSIFEGASLPLKIRNISDLRKFFFSPKFCSYSSRVTLNGFMEIGFSFEYEMYVPPK